MFTRARPPQKKLAKASPLAARRRRKSLRCQRTEARTPDARFIRRSRRSFDDRRPPDWRQRGCHNRVGRTFLSVGLARRARMSVLPSWANPWPPPALPGLPGDPPGIALGLSHGLSARKRTATCGGEDFQPLTLRLNNSACAARLIRRPPREPAHDSAARRRMVLATHSIRMYLPSAKSDSANSGASPRPRSNPSRGHAAFRGSGRRPAVDTGLDGRTLLSQPRGVSQFRSWRSG